MSESSNPSEPSHIGAWPLRFINFWLRITEPEPSLPEPERRQARILSALVMALIIMNVLVSIPLFIVTKMDYDYDFDFIILFLTTAGFFVIYRISRGRYYRWAAIATIALIFVSIGTIALQNNQFYFLDILAIAIVAGSLFLSTRQTILVSILAMGMVLSFLAVVPDVDTQQGIDIVIFLGSIGILTILGSRLNQRDLALIEEQAHRLSAEIEERKRTQETLAASEERFRSTLESMMESCQIVGYDWRYLFVNDAFIAQSKQNREQLLGRTMTECFPGIEKTDVFAAFRRCMEERTSHNMQREFRYPDGTQGWFELSIQPAPDGILILSTDVTERVQAEENLRQQTARAEALVRTAARLNADLNLDAVLEAVCTETALALDVPAVAITLVDAASQTLPVVSDYGFPSDHRLRATPIPLASYTTFIEQNPGPFVVPDVQAVADLPDAELYREMDARTVVGVNLLRKGTPVGSLNVISVGTPRLFSQDELTLLQGLADQAAQAIANAQLYAEHVQYEKTLRISETSLREAQKIAKIGSWTWDVANNDVVWSDEMYNILGLDKTKQSSKLDDIFRVIHPDDQARVAQVSEQAAKEVRPIPIEYRIVTPDGTLKHILGQGTTITDEIGNPTHLFGTIQDISERKEVEAERVARQSAEQASAAKSEFLSRMSHELRTPMNSILGFAQLLEMSRNESLTSTQRARVEQILKAGQHLLELINEVLEISRIEAGRLDISLEAVAVAKVVSEVLDLTVPLAGERQIRVRREIDPEQETYVKADQQRFKQVLINLVSNAIKYNSEGGEVRLTCESRPDGWQRISVYDTGPGIALADQARLFQPFERLGGAQHAEVTGTGLGLALSKRLVELMGGQIGVESEIGKGSTFWIELPAAAPQLNGEVSQSNDRPRPEIRGEDQTILYIEDNLTNFDLVEQVLADESQVSLIWAIQGSIGLDLARQHLPDLILLDLHLPDMHGSEVLAQLHKDEATRGIPVIVISADATPHQIERLMTGGADAYLTKPLNVSEFLQTVESLIAKS